MKRVLILDTPSRFTRFGGEQRIAALLYKGLAKRFKTYYLGSETGFLRADANTFIIPHVEGGKRSRVYDNFLVRMAYYTLMIKRLGHLKAHMPQIISWLERIRPEVIIDNSVQDYRLSMMIKELMPSARRIYIDHGSISTLKEGSVFHSQNIPLSLGTGINGLTLDGLKRQFFASYDLCVALNMEQLEQMRRYTSKVAYIPNGIELPAKVDKTLKGRVRERYGIGERDFVVMNIGRMFDRQKNISTLIRAFRKVKENGVKLVLVGTGPDLHSFMELAKGDDRVIFSGSLSETEINAMYEIADLFVLPSIWEGLPLTLLEAANHGLPIAISSNIYFDDFKRKKIRLDTFDPYSTVGIRDTILAYLKGAAKRKAAQRESARISREFSLAAMLKIYIARIGKL
ncbi:MAG TPA: glycosyltransferase family 4 protein [Candidatus Baltobacteraceae bacterium]|nr:glycosyltransferase family 4 protein [Candidatus Baltobacteraceae bacterium]